MSNESLSARTIQSALRKTTEALARELACPSGVVPDWSQLEWRVARAAAVIHGASPLLSATVPPAAPLEWRRFLEQQRQHTAKRQYRIEALLRRLDEQARAESLPVIALKGSALHASGLYATGERPMADVDLLVRSEQVPAALRVLEALGFRQAWSYWKHRVLLPRESVDTLDADGEHADADIKIELHERICEILPLRVTDVSHHIFPARPRPGLNAYPSQAALMCHLLVHAAGAMAYRRVRLINLHDLALLSARMSPQDWDELLSFGPAGYGPWWGLPPLRLTARYYESRVPQRVLEALAKNCPRRLQRVSARRTLSDVSLSYLWVEAFPGVEWAQSLTEIFQYSISRLLPSEDTLAMRKVMQSESWATNDRWYRLSHGRRMLQFATGRVPRAASMYAVRSALQQAVQPR
jgi:hypothetical protein